MAKFKCECGHIIRDQTDSLPYKGEIIRDKHWGEFYGRISRTVAEFMAACSAGQRSQWTMKFYSAPADSPVVSMDDESIVSDIITYASVACCLAVFQCEECARLYVSRTPEKWDFVKFVPTENCEAILDVKEGATP